MSQVTEVRNVAIGDWLLSVTVRDAGDDPKLLEELTYRTILMWINIVRRLEQQNYAYDGGSVEQTLAAEIPTVDEHPFEFQPPWGDGSSRVTVWSTFRGSENPNFHLNSDDTPQVAIDVWRANQLGSERAIAKFNSLFPNASQSHQNAPNSSATPPQATTTPKAPENAQKATNEALQHNHDAKCYTRKEALDEFEAGAEFSMQICKIMKRSQDGNEYYEFYHKYGQNPGKFAELRLYADNEVALKNGLMDSLDALALKPGQDRLGEWLLKCRVAENAKKGENVVYPLALSN